MVFVFRMSARAPVSGLQEMKEETDKKPTRRKKVCKNTGLNELFI